MTYMQKLKTYAILGFATGVIGGLLDAFVYPIV